MNDAKQDCTIGSEDKHIFIMSWTHILMAERWIYVRIYNNLFHFYK
jgi:hypothetical protein